MSVTLCRLCSGTEQLTDLFDPRLNNSEQLRFYFLLATGLEIREDDVVSKMVCHRCCEIAIKLHKYRANAVANDKLLKEQCGQLYVAPTTDQDELRRISAQILTSNGKMFAAPYGHPTDGRLLLVDPKSSTNHEALDLLNVTVKSEPLDYIPRLKPEPYKHESIKNLYETNPGIILPPTVLNCDINPEVTLDESEVTEWAEEEFKRVQQKLSFAKILIQKVGETSASSDVKVNQVSASNAFKSKPPGPKSKTMLIVDKPPSSALPIKVSPTAKQRTDNFANNGKLLSSNTALQTKYRAGPKSRKSDLIVGSGLFHPVREITLKTEVSETASTKQIQTQSKPAVNSIKQTEAQKPSSTTQNTFSNSDDDDDFDPGFPFSDNTGDSDSDHDFDTPKRLNRVKTRSKRFGARKVRRPTRRSEVDKLGSLTDVPTTSRKRTPSDESEKTDKASKRPTPNTRNRSEDKNMSRKVNSPCPENSESHKISTRRTTPANKNDNEDKINPRKVLLSYTSISNSESRTESETRNDTRSRKRVSSVESGGSDDVKKRKTTDISVKTEMHPAKNNIVTESKKAEGSTKTPLVKKGRFEPRDRSESGNKVVKPSDNVKTTPVQQKSDNESLIPKIYMCHTCCKLFETSKELSDHQKSHLICKYCNYRMKNLETLNKHQMENCRMNVDRHKPPKPPQKVEEKKISLIKLTKVEEIKSIVNKYSKAFDDDSSSIKKDTVVYSNTKKIKKDVSDTSVNASNDKKRTVASINVKNSIKKKSGDTDVVSNNKVKIKGFGYTGPTGDTKKAVSDVTRTKDAKKRLPTTVNALDNVSEVTTTNPETPQVPPSETTPQTDPPLPTIQIIKTETVALSDTEDEVYCVDDDTNATPTSFLELPLSGLTEQDMIQSLFTKHLKNGVKKLQRTSQTFLPQAKDVKYTNANLIVLENLFDQLYTYKIPIQLEIRPRISARFVEEFVPPLKSHVESWAHIKTVNIKPVSSNKTIAPAKFQTPKSRSEADSLKTNSVENANTFPTPTPVFNKALVVNSGTKFSQILPKPVSSSKEPPVCHSSTIVPATQAMVVVSNNSQVSTSSSPILGICPQTNTITSGTKFSQILPKPVSSSKEPPACHSPTIVPATQAMVVVSNNSQVSTPTSPILGTTQALIVPQTNDNSLILSRLLDTSPTVPSSASLITNPNLFINSPLIDNNAPFVTHFLTSEASATNNMTTTLIQTSNTGTLFLHNGVSPNSTTIIQSVNQPSTSTLMQSPQTPAIQSPNSSSVISNSSPSSMLLMQAVPQVSNSTVINAERAVSSNNLIFQTPTQQIYQINNAGPNTNKVVVFSNVMSNGIQQNMPLYTTPSFFNNFPIPHPPTTPESSVSIEEIDEGQQTGTSKNKVALRIKPGWELY